MIFQHGEPSGALPYVAFFIAALLKEFWAYRDHRF